jgi:hypothetical protein
MSELLIVQAMLAEERIREWGGTSDTLPATATMTVTNNGLDRRSVDLGKQIGHCHLYVQGNTEE